jgi:precorrin-4/cobalt-precorrin-4 C11-methyltransferase
VLTRTSGRASAMPPGETLEAFAATGSTLAIHLSVHVLASVVARLAPAYGADCAIAVVYRASWPDQRIVRGTLATIVDAVDAARLAGAALDRTATILVGPVLDHDEFRESALYSTEYQRRFRGRAGP